MKHKDESQKEMQNIKVKYRIPESDTRHWTDIYNALLDALFIPEVDGPKMEASSGGPIRNEGAWLIIESMSDPDALYLNMTVTRDSVEIRAMNCTKEKVRKVNEICKDLIKC